MKHVVGVSDMAVSKSPGDTIVTFALGSCIGVTVHDPVAKVGGILHYMLPNSKIDAVKAEKFPLMFGDIGIPMLFRKVYELGAVKNRIRVVIAGGAQLMKTTDTFNIGKRNIVTARKLFWKNNILIAAEHVGSTISRTLYLDISSGETWFTSKGKRVDL